MAKTTRYVGLDVHASSISVAIADNARKSEVRYLGQIPNDFDAIKRMLKRQGPVGTFCIGSWLGLAAKLRWWRRR